MNFSKREVQQPADRDFTDVVYAFDVPRVHVSYSLLEPITSRKNIRTKPKLAKRWQTDTKTH